MVPYSSSGFNCDDSKNRQEEFGPVKVFLRSLLSNQGDKLLENPKSGLLTYKIAASGRKESWFYTQPVMKAQQ